MWYLTQQYWFWLILALVLGLVIGWMTFAPRKTSWWSGWVPLAAIAFGIGLALAWMKLIRGLPGLWLDTALLFFTAYIAGCFLGSWFKGLFAGAEAPQTLAMAAAAPVMAAVPVAPVKAEPVARVAAPVEAMPAVAETRPELQAAAYIEGQDKIAGARPAGFAGPRNGKADDLKLIKGIGQQNEGRLHALGIWHFDQISSWTKQNVLWVGSYLAFPGRIEREDWVKQARQLAAGKETEFSKRAKWGLVPTSLDDGSKGQGNIKNVPRKTGE